MAQPDGWTSVVATQSCDFIPHQDGMSVCAAGSSARTVTTAPTGTSPMRWASQMIGIGHLRPSASMTRAGAGSSGSAASGGGGVGLRSWRLGGRMALVRGAAQPAETASRAHRVTS